MPQSTEGVLLVIGALFFLIGLLGGGFEVSAIKIPPIEKYPRAVVFGMGIVLLIAGLFRILFPATPVITPALNTVVAVATLPPPTVPIASSPTQPPPSATPVPPTFTPIPPTATLAATSTPTAATPEDTATPNFASTGTIKDITVDYDVTQFGQVGMLIHVKFGVAGMKGLKGRVLAYFYDDKGGELTSSDTKDLTADGLYKYQATDGQLIVWDYFTPIYDDAQFTDFQLFLPYSAIELPSGSYDLTFRVSLRDMRDATKGLAISPDYTFKFSRK